MARLDLVALLAVAALVCAEQALGAAERPKRFRAGAAVSNITPALGVSMDGIIMRQGPIEHIHDDLNARAVALDDGRTCLALCVCDLCMIPRDIMDKAKAIAHERTGIPTGHMLVSATHTHSAPRIGCGTGELDKQYFEFLARRIADAIARAHHNLAPAKAGWGVGRKPEFTRNRRWLIQPGKVPMNPFDETTDQVMMYGNRKGIGVKPAGPVDPEVSVLSVQHADGRPLALLANYSIHYVTTLGRQASADYYGMFARRVEELLGSTERDVPFVAIMSNGTFGDIGGVGGGYANVRRVGYALADEALRVRREIEHRDDITLAVREAELELGVRRPDAQRLAWAKQVLADPKPKKGQHPWRVKYAQDAVRLIEELARSLRTPTNEGKSDDLRANLDRLRRELARLPVRNPADGVSNRDHDRELYGESP